jgi:hypothetical protein
MKPCPLAESPDVELYFYGELDAAAHDRVEAHLRGCEACRQRLDDLRAIRTALADRPAVDAPPAGDWSGFMRRLDSAVAVERSGGSVPSAAVAPVALAAPARPAASKVRLTHAVAATLAIVVMGAFMAARVRQMAPAKSPTGAVAPQPASPAARTTASSEDRALREVSAEHLERSKLVVLGLATLDPKRTPAADWQYERQLAGSLLDDTRLYRQAAQQRGMTDVAHVMRDLETVLIETSMSDTSDREALARVQRLIAKRDLVVKMQLVSTN